MFVRNNYVWLGFHICMQHFSFRSTGFCSISMSRQFCTTDNLQCSLPLAVIPIRLLSILACLFPSPARKPFSSVYNACAQVYYSHWFYAVKKAVQMYILCTAFFIPMYYFLQIILLFLGMTDYWRTKRATGYCPQYAQLVSRSSGLLNIMTDHKKGFPADMD